MIAVEPTLIVGTLLSEWLKLGGQQLSRECLPGSDQLWPEGIVRIPRYRPEPVEALKKIANKAMGLTESLRSPGGLATTKHAEPSFEVLVVPLDSLLHGFSGEVLDLREHGSQRERVGSGLVGGHRVWRHPRVLESGTKERCRGFGVAVLLEQDFHDLPVFVDGAVHVAPAPGDFHIRLILSAKSGGRSEPGKPGTTCFSLTDAIEPAHRSLNVHRCGRDGMLQAGFG